MVVLPSVDAGVSEMTAGDEQGQLCWPMVWACTHVMHMLPGHTAGANQSRICRLQYRYSPGLKTSRN